MTTAALTAPTRATTAPTPGFLARHIPLIGLIRRELSDRANVPLLVIALLLTLWAMAIVTWGIPALYLPAVAAAPCMIVMLVMITRG
jgi:hypothetical protein